MTSLDLTKLAVARTELAKQGELGSALIKFLDTAEQYVNKGIRWGLIESTAADIVSAVTKQEE